VTPWPSPLLPIDLTDARQVRTLLSRYGVRLTRDLGQHLLVDRDVLDRIIGEAALGRDSLVLEVGPGVGALTEALSRNAGRVVAVELDDRLLDLLHETVRAPNVEIVHGDALAVDPATYFGADPYDVVANLPYGIATPLIRRLLNAPPAQQPQAMVVMVQREVARRLAAPAGDMSRLSVETQLVADVSLRFEIGPEAFFPPPVVSSAVVRLRPLRGYRVPPLPNLHRFLQTVEAGFRHRRKQLHNALGDLGVGTERIAAALAETRIDGRRRAETLALEEWSLLSDALWRS
jgi:16S rRNA (adenine1518-N6/adenine1519-N6)-dimethyltransferase